MRRFFALLSLCIAAVGVYLFWFSRTHTSLLELINILQPSSQEILPEGTLSPLLPESEEAFTLVQKSLIVPDAFAVSPFNTPRTLRIPQSATTSVFAAGLKKARFMAVSPEGWPGGAGILYLTESDQGRVLALPDRNRDGIADEVVGVAFGLDYPHGIAFHGNALWVATTTSVRKFFDDDGDLRADRMEVVVGNLPSGGNHVSRTIAFGQDGKLYVSVGSSCNVCEDDPRRAAILRFNEDGTGEERFATGSRNAVGIVFDTAGNLWGTENGRDFLGDDVPPEEINILRYGKDYGWPYCYADGIVDRTFTRRTRLTVPVEAFCASTERPVVKLQAHTAPLGLRFLDHERLPSALRGGLLVALHGSWNRKVPVGYEVILVRGLPDAPMIQPFVTGFLPEGARKAWGRPVDVIVGADGAIYISDDYAGAVYRLSFP